MRFPYTILFPVVSLTLLLGGCHKAAETGAKTEAPPPARNPLEIEVPRHLMEQIQTGEPAWSEVSAKLRVAARIEADETRVARVGSPVTGRVSELHVLEGQRVKKGEVLATLNSTELSNAQFAFLRALSQRHLRERAAARARQLLSAGVLAEAELQRREAEVAESVAEMASSRDQLSVLGMSEEAITRLQSTRSVNSVTQVVASIGGMVLERRVTLGQVVQPADTMFVVADLSHVWVVADIPEQTAGNIMVGKSAEAEIPSLPGRAVRGRIAFVGAIVNPETRTIRARLDLPNPGFEFKPAMLATMILQDEAQKHLTVPAGAVVREGNTENVFVQTGPSRFVLRRAELAGESADLRVVTGGLKPGEKIVTAGAFHLNNERKRLGVQGQ